MKIQQLDTYVVSGLASANMVIPLDHSAGPYGRLETYFPAEISCLPLAAAADSLSTNAAILKLQRSSGQKVNTQALHDLHIWLRF